MPFGAFAESICERVEPADAERAIDAQEPKHRFPAGFRTSLLVFNLHCALATGASTVIVVEGFFDSLAVHQHRVSLDVAAPPLPRVWMAMQMKDGEHGHEVVFNGEERPVRKITDEGTPSALVDLRKLERILEHSGKDGV